MHFERGGIEYFAGLGANPPVHGIRLRKQQECLVKAIGIVVNLAQRKPRSDAIAWRCIRSRQQHFEPSSVLAVGRLSFVEHEIPMRGAEIRLDLDSAAEALFGLVELPSRTLRDTERNPDLRHARRQLDRTTEMQQGTRNLPHAKQGDAKGGMHRCIVRPQCDGCFVHQNRLVVATQLTQQRGKIV